VLFFRLVRDERSGLLIPTAVFQQQFKKNLLAFLSFIRAIRTTSSRAIVQDAISLFD
jgi:hypothetical protein